MAHLPNAPPPDSLFEGPGEIRALCRALDWSATTLGPAASWTPGLRLAVRMCLDARFPMSVWAGADLALLYNEGYPPVLGPEKHPWALGRPAREVWAEVWDRVGPELERVMRHGESTVHEDERFLLRRGGGLQESYFTYSFTPIVEADGRIAGALNVFVETTERVRSLGEQTARYRAVFQSASDAIVVTDPAGAGRVLSVNPAACQLFGYAEAEFLGLDRTTMLDAENPALRRLLEARDRLGDATEVLTYRRKDGTPFQGELRSTYFTDVQGRRLAVAIIRNVTEQVRARDALAASEQRYRTLFESIDEGFCIVQAVFDQAGEATDYRFLEHNPAFQRHTGLSSAAGRTVRELVPGIEPLWLELVGGVARGGEPTRQEGRVEALGRWFDVYAFRMGEPEERRVAMLFRDITARRRAEDARREAQEQLEEADRRRSHFLAVLSHELRNPLTPIRNSLYLLDRVSPGGDQARRTREVLGRQVDQLTRLVDDLLDVTRITRGKVQLQRERLELTELVRRTLEDHRSLFDHSGIEVRLEAAPGPVFVHADWSRIAQVLGNLLQNAAKFTPDAGAVTVSIRADAAARQAVVRVADDGAGMAPEMLARLFEPFSQADATLDRTRGGLGLGLALVKGLVEQHGGSVEATSAGLGRGAEFTIRLPLAPEEPASRQRDGPAAAPARRRVLLIEDNVDAAQSLCELLELDGHEVAVAYDGPQGIARAREFRPEIVLCDIGLPGMDGYAVARALRAEEGLRGTRLVALSGYALPEDLERAAEAGFERHLAKPPSPEKLERLLGGE